MQLDLTAEQQQLLEARLAAQTCLVVDDEPRLRQVLVRFLEREGFACREASDGASALAALEHEPVPLVISDLRMPGMDGVELLRVIRERYPDIAVIMLTGVSDVEVAVSCLAAGAMDYLTKPFHVEEVRARVGRALERRRLIIENRDYQERLEERVSAQARRLEELFLAGVQSLADALELKDRYTRGHSIRVSRYSAAVAITMGLNGDFVRQIDLGGHVHDIGKIGVREGVLNKSGSLTPEEYEHVMTHPLIGWRILGPLLRDAPVALNVVRSHHERVDGRGRPDGLRGDAIPLEARIAAVADSFDAMTTTRPYRGALSLAEAVAELGRSAGTQLDGAVVDAFARAVKDGVIQLLPRASTGEHVAIAGPEAGMRV